MKKSPGAVDPHPGLFLPEHLGGLKKGQQPHPQLLLLPHPQPLLFHPPQQNRRIRTSQQAFFLFNRFFMRLHLFLYIFTEQSGRFDDQNDDQDDVNDGILI